MQLSVIPRAEHFISEMILNILILERKYCPVRIGSKAPSWLCEILTNPLWGIQDKISRYKIYPDILTAYKIPQDIIPESEERQNPAQKSQQNINTCYCLIMYTIKLTDYFFLYGNIYKDEPCHYSDSVFRLYFHQILIVANTTKKLCTYNWLTS